MRRLFPFISLFLIGVLLITGCSRGRTQPSTSSAETSPQFSELNPPESSSEDFSRETPAETEPPHTEEPTLPAESSTEETPPEETVPPETLPEETTPEETTREVLDFIPVNEQVTATTSVNVRDDYSLQGNIIAVLKRGDVVTRIGYHEEWSRVMFNGGEYYVSSHYLTTETLPPETPPPTEAPTEAPTEPPAVEPPKPVPPYDPSFLDNLSGAAFTGRWFRKDINGVNCYATLNAGSELDFQISGASYLYLYMTAVGEGEFTYAYSIDGQAPVRQDFSNGTIALGNTNPHTIRIVIDSLGDSDRWNEQTVFGVCGLASDGGAFTPWVYGGTIIAFYGDSITEGYRSLGTSTHSYVHSYAWNCSLALGDRAIVAGFPGSGVTVEGLFNTCINAITNYSSSRPSEPFSPAFVVLEHGQNDAHTASDVFCQAYGTVLDTLRSQYPSAKIVCLIPLSQEHADDIRNCVNAREGFVLVETQDWGVTFISDNLHPDANGAAIMGSRLAEILRGLE